MSSYRPVKFESWEFVVRAVGRMGDFAEAGSCEFALDLLLENLDYYCREGDTGAASWTSPGYRSLSTFAICCRIGRN